MSALLPAFGELKPPAWALLLAALLGIAIGASLPSPMVQDVIAALAH